jgi:hypothetical protein
MKTEKKKITVTLTAHEAKWLWDRLQNIHRNADDTPVQREAAFMAKALQDRLESES